MSTSSVPAEPRIPRVGDTVKLLTVQWGITVPSDPGRGREPILTDARVTRVLEPGNPRSHLDLIIDREDIHDNCLPIRDGIMNRHHDLRFHWACLDEYGQYDLAPPPEEPIVGQTVVLYAMKPMLPANDPNCRDGGGWGWRPGRVVEANPEAAEWGECSIALPETETLTNVAYGGSADASDRTWCWPIDPAKTGC